MPATRIPVTASDRTELEIKVAAQLAQLPEDVAPVVDRGEIWGRHGAGAMPIAVIYVPPVTA